MLFTHLNTYIFVHRGQSSFIRLRKVDVTHTLATLESRLKKIHKKKNVSCMCRPYRASTTTVHTLCTPAGLWSDGFALVSLVCDVRVSSRFRYHS